MKSREQYRLQGGVKFILSNALREQVWAQLSLSTRAQFHWPKPGEVLLPEDVLAVDQIDLESLRDAPISPNFLLFKVVAGYVDYLSLGERHRRWISVKSWKGWDCAEVTPALTHTTDRHTRLIQALKQPVKSETLLVADRPPSSSSISSVLSKLTGVGR